LFAHPFAPAAVLVENGDQILGLHLMGFGFTGRGTVTPKPQPGNPKPRVFRLPREQGIINRMGFNNKGVDHLLKQVSKARREGFTGVLGINIGKNLSTAVEDAAKDYLIGLEKVYLHADYIVVNVSSPNTPGLRSLQFGQAMEELLSTLKERHTQLQQQHGSSVPLLLKVAPDLDDFEIKALADQFLAFGIDGIIVSNTTSGRLGVENNPISKEAGGLSGKPLFDLSTSALAKFAGHLQGKIPLIGVGGINSAADAVVKQQAGASLVQVYSGFIYHGPGLIHSAAQKLGRLS